jgi:class 3 adenylate cyclase
MRCKSCSAEIPENSRFCLKCGTPLVETATAPARPSVDGFALIQNYIPRDLARKILDAGKKIESERRLVTVLFADVTGFTALSEKMDLEDVSMILNDCFGGLISVILKYEGTIDKFIGDGIMAIFGAPLAHENDPERAVRCALDMLTEIDQFNMRSTINVPTPLGLHVGLHSGWVIAGNVGNDLRMDYSVIGDTVNLASRLVEIAPRGEIYLTEDTFKLVSEICAAEGPTPKLFRGKTEPVNIYRLKGLKSDEEAKRQQLTQDQFVGREKEIEVAKEALNLVTRKAQARLFIRGEAGVGKSRLKAELVKYSYQQAIAVFEGSCSSFETNTPYYLWTSLFRNILKVTTDMSEAEARRRLHQATQALGIPEHEPYLGALLSLRYEEVGEVEDAVRKQRIFQATRVFLSAYALRRRVAFVLEDLHWIDRFSQELLEYMFSRTTSVVLALFVLIFRDEYVGAKDLVEEGQLIDLNRLAKPEAQKLIKLRLGADVVPPEVEALVLQRSEGNPFFIQEIIKTLVDKKKIAVRRRKVEIVSEDIEAGIPGTIQGIIMARIDRIQDSIKEVLLRASVIGREFSTSLLEKVVERKGELAPTLEELRSLELILQKDEAREYDFLFKHFLIQEVAYNTILVNKRKELHATIARAVEQLFPDRLMEFYELLAFHYEKAEMWDKAAEYLSKSGHKAGQMYSGEESRAFFERREEAVKKLYEAASAKPSLGATLKAIGPPLVAMLIPILPVFAYVRLIGTAHLGDLVTQIVIGAIVCLLCIWYAVALWFLGVVPFLRGRPKLYDIMEDHVRMIYWDGKTLAIDFGEIQSMRYVDAKSRAKRPFAQKLIDPFGRLMRYDTVSFGSWMREVVLNILPPYSFGFGAGKAEIHVRLYKGYQVLRLFFPWLNTPLKSRDLSLVPGDPKEFFHQLEFAFKRWTKHKK